MNEGCDNCQHAAGSDCARVPAFPVPQPQRRTCRNHKFRHLAEGETCPSCDGAGWECHPHPSNGQPMYRECWVCHNETGRPSP